MNVKPSDLTVVVNDGGKFENLGLIVNVISFEGSFFWWKFGSQPSWQVEVFGSRGLCYWRSDHELYLEHQGKMPDCCLKRIEPVLNETFPDHEEPLEAVLFAT
uniref:hypothetical protein n=1 Tax=Algoriphagus sp. TaxID=1872435 RepID=UPI0040480714